MVRHKEVHRDEQELFTGKYYEAFRHIYPVDRFLNNPFADHVLYEDYLSAQIQSDGSLQLRTFIYKNNKIPKVFEWAWPKNVERKVQFVEEININYASLQPTIHQISRNIDKRQIMVAHERVMYKLYPQSQKVTTIKEFLVDSPIAWGGGTAMRGFGVWRYHANEIKASNGLTVMCDNWLKSQRNSSTSENATPPQSS